MLTGRGANTLPDKNLLPVLGKPLMTYPASAAKASALVDDFFVSSDDDKILDAGAAAGYKKIKRPPELGTPEAKHVDVLLHALKFLEREKNVPDVLVVLLANSVSIKTEWIDDCIRIIQERPEVSAVVPAVQDQDRHPHRAKRHNPEGFLESFFDFEEQTVSSNRQELEPSYFLCHNFWALNVRLSLLGKDGQPPWEFMGDRVLPYVVEDCPDVHTLEDISRSEEWLRKNF